MDTGDVVLVVLDYHEDSDGREARIFVQGVFPRNAPLPKPGDGVVRNVVQVFYGHDMRHVSAFRIPLGITREQLASAVEEDLWTSRQGRHASRSSSRLRSPR